ncbi:MAG TPA: response regulator FixJ [Caulobacteraceae bacterium]|nr:response regulator FixJ [Caulobacteraceae bacterium]
MSEPTVHVIDDDADVRASLAFLLETADTPVQTYESAAAFLDIAPEASGCVVTDVRMPGMTGLELVEQLKARGIELPVIVITGHGDIALAVEAMKAGVVDFLEKPFDDEALLGAIRSALVARAEEDRRDAQKSEIRQKMEALSPRERQVLDGLVAGKANKVMANELDISPRTIEIYRAHVMTKMQARSLSELVRMALAAGAG